MSNQHKINKYNSKLNESNDPIKSEKYKKKLLFYKQRGGILSSIHKFKLDVYEFKLNGYPTTSNPDKALNSGNKNWMTMENVSLRTTGLEDVKEQNNNCGMFNVNLNSDTVLRGKLHSFDSSIDNNIRSCDYMDGNIELLNDKREDIDLDNISNVSFKINVNNIIIRSDSLIQFIRKFGSKRNNIPTRSEMLNSPLWSIYDYNIARTIISELDKALTATTKLTFNPNEKTYCKHIIAKPEDKFIVFGDFHGSFPTLVRHLLRFRKMKVLDENFIAINNYKIIFLGDLVDRGVYGYEMLFFVFLLKIKNPNNVFINRGNHEEMQTNSYMGFRQEMKIKFEHDDNNIQNSVYYHLSSVLKKSHSALVIRTPDNKNIWLAHGGVPIIKIQNEFVLDPIVPKCLIEDTLLTDYNDQPNFKSNDQNERGASNLFDNHTIDTMFPYTHSYSSYHEQFNDSQGRCIRWMDWSTVNASGHSINNGRYMAGNDIIDSLAYNNIHFVIRAHQDSSANTKILREGDYDPTSIHNIIGRNKRCEGPFSSIYLDENNKVQLTHNADLSRKIKPVITISTNTDYGRNLIRESFVILRFDDAEIKCRDEQILLNQESLALPALPITPVIAPVQSTFSRSSLNNAFTNLTPIVAPKKDPLQ